MGSVQELPAFLEGLESWCIESGLDMRHARQFVLMLDELLTNVAVHGYQGHGGWIEVVVEALESMALEARISDKGPAFDPTRRIPVDISAGIDERKIGGLGVHFIHQLADEFAYQRVQDTNVVKIKKLAK